MPSYLYQYESLDLRTQQPHRCVGGYFEAESDEAAAEIVRVREANPETNINTNPWFMGSPPFTIFRIEPVRVYPDRDPEPF